VAHLLRNPSRYRARVDSEACIGCGKCIDRCFFGAIEIKEIPGSKYRMASINEEKCMGCGLCGIGCDQKALIFDLVKPPEYLAIDHEQEAPPPSGGENPIWRPFASA